MYLELNGIDFSHLTASLKIGYETLVSDNSGRNARGDTFIDIVNLKHKVYVTFRVMSEDEMLGLLAAIDNYVIPVSFLDPKTKQMKTITAYCGTPEPDYFTIQPGKVLYNEMSLNFIEL